MPQPFIAYSPEEADVYKDFGHVEGVGFVKHFGPAWEAEQKAKADAEKAERTAALVRDATRQRIADEKRAAADARSAEIREKQAAVRSDLAKGRGELAALRSDRAQQAVKADELRAELDAMKAKLPNLFNVYDAAVNAYFTLFYQGAVANRDGDHTAARAHAADADEIDAAITQARQALLEHGADSKQIAARHRAVHTDHAVRSGFLTS